MKVSFKDIDDLGSVLASLDPDHKDQFWAWTATAPQNVGGSRPIFHGYPIEYADFERSDEDVLFFKSPISPDLRTKIEALTRAQNLTGRGFLDDDHVLLFVGWEKQSGRFFALPRRAADEFLESLFPNAQLTPSDRVLLLELFVGLDLRQAADRTGKAYETKRRALKSVSKKTNIPKQTDLVAFVVSEFLLALSSIDRPRAQKTNVAGTYLADHLPAGARLHHIGGPSGQTHLVLDIGPQTGRPILSAAPLIVPQFRSEDIEFLNEQGIRLYCPLRPGTLSPDADSMADDTYTALVIEGMDVTCSLLAHEEIPVLGLSNGCFFATLFAEQAAEKIHSLTLGSAMIGAPKQSSLVESFRSGIFSLATRNRASLGLAIDFLVARATAPEAFKSIFLKILSQGSPLDHETVVEDFSDPARLAAYHFFCLNSAAYLKADFASSRPLPLDVLAKLECPICFVHGTENEADLLNDVIALAASLKAADVVTLDGAGHILRQANLHRLLAIAADS